MKQRPWLVKQLLTKRQAPPLKPPWVAIVALALETVVIPFGDIPDVEAALALAMALAFQDARMACYLGCFEKWSLSKGSRGSCSSLLVCPRSVVPRPFIVWVHPFLFFCRPRRAIRFSGTSFPFTGVISRIVGPRRPMIFRYIVALVGRGGPLSSGTSSP